MGEKMTWSEMVRAFPDEWVALVDYKQTGAVEIEGEVVTHGPDRKEFHETVRKLLPEYGDMALRYTGELIKNPETPLLWQITPTG